MTRFAIGLAVAAAAVAALPAAGRAFQTQALAALNFAFTEIAETAGLTATTVYGGRQTNRYLLETTGCGAAAFDYDGDGWLDLFVVNGTTLDGFPEGKEPTSHLYRNRRDGTFEDVTARAGLALVHRDDGDHAAR